MTATQIKNTKWLIEYIESNAGSFSYAVPGHWDSAQEAIDTFAIDDDAHRKNVGETGLAILDEYCRTGDADAADIALILWLKTT